MQLGALVREAERFPEYLSTRRKVGLIIPPSPFLLDERVFVSLGILKVAGVLRAENHWVNVLDLSGVTNFLDALRTYLDDHNVSVIGVTATTPQFPATAEIAQEIRRLRPDVKLILGGPHATLTMAAVKVEKKAGRIGRAARAAKQLTDLFDVICTGDGEFTVLDAVQPGSPALLDGDDHKGDYFMDDDDFDASPMPARDLVDIESYKYTIDGAKATNVIAQLGCPFNCGFCGGRNSKSLRVIRTRSSESVVAEIEHLYTKYGYTGFMFQDDELNVNKTMVETMNAIAALQKRLGVEFRMRGFIKAELFTDEQAEAMYRAGFRWLLCGFEGADPRILDNILKRATVEDNTRVMEIAHRHGLKVKALMSIGHPGESEKTVQAIHDWLLKVRADDFDCTIITPYPGSPYYDAALPGDKPGTWVYTQPKSGDKLYAAELDYSKTADYYKGDPEGGYKAYVWTDHLQPEQLVKLRDNLERSVRAKLGIPFNQSRAALRFEHSMGMGLPDFILRSKT